MGDRAKPILLVLDEKNEVLVERALRQGIDDCIVKPVDPEELVHRCQALLKQSNIERALKVHHDQRLEQSTKDSLTGLYNRYFLDEMIPKQLTALTTLAQPACLLVIDLDGLKRVNDELGHSHGDRLITTAAELFRNAVRNSDLCFRLGGDEFAIFLPSTDVEGGVALAERLLSQPSDDCEALAMSIGIALAKPEDKASLSTLMEKADQAMYQAKKAGGRSYRLSD